MRLRHIDDLELEDYARWQEPRPAHLARLRAHLAVCPECRVRALEIAEFVDFLTADPEESAGHIYTYHGTGQGTVFLVVTGSDSEGWEALIIGAGRDSKRWFHRGGAAKTTLERWFKICYPGHKCTNGCCGGWK
jgi:hypothetical protein